MASQLKQRKNPFEIENDNHFRVALSQAIWRLVPTDIPPKNLIARGAHLNRHERLFWAVEMFDSNSCADGTGHVFYYGYGVLLPYILEGLREIGANDTAVGLEEYVQTFFGASIPQDEETMQNFMDANQDSEESAGDKFAYFRQTDEVNRLLAVWARRNRAHFRVS